MRVRSKAFQLVLAATAAAAIGLGTAGCTFFAPQASRIHYDPADGISVDLGEVQLRDAKLVAAEGDPSRLTLSFTAVNDGEATTLHYEYDAAGGGGGTVELPSGLTSVGGELLPVLEAPNGAVIGGLYEVVLQAGASDTTPVMLPVLDPTGRPYLEDLVPGPVAPVAPVETLGAGETPASDETVDSDETDETAAEAETPES